MSVLLMGLVEHPLELCHARLFLGHLLLHVEQGQRTLLLSCVDLVLLADSDRVHAGVAGTGHDIA